MSLFADRRPRFSSLHIAYPTLVPSVVLRGGQSALGEEEVVSTSLVSPRAQASKTRRTEQQKRIVTSAVIWISSSSRIYRIESVRGMMRDKFGKVEHATARPAVVAFQGETTRLRPSAHGPDLQLLEETLEIFAAFVAILRQPLLHVVTQYRQFVCDRQ